MMPLVDRYLSSVLIRCEREMTLFDCGEGTQERLRQAEVNFNRIGTVFISHMHGDHYFGLMGLLSSMHLNGRTGELHVYGPPELREVIDVQLRASQTWLRYPLRIHALEPVTGTIIHEDQQVQVLSLKLKHRIPTTGFLFCERPQPRRLRKDRLPDVPHYARVAIKHGEDLLLPGGRSIPNAELTFDPPVPRRYAYCSDTAYAPELVSALAGVDLLYHEATFTDDLSDRARETCHSTAKQAAMMAREANVRELLLGHFSSRYKDPRSLLEEAIPVFPRTRLAEEGRTFRIGPTDGVGNSDMGMT